MKFDEEGYEVSFHARDYESEDFAPLCGFVASYGLNYDSLVRDVTCESCIAKLAAMRREHLFIACCVVCGAGRSGYDQQTGLLVCEKVRSFDGKAWLMHDAQRRLFEASK